MARGRNSTVGFFVVALVSMASLGTWFLLPHERDERAAPTREGDSELASPLAEPATLAERSEVVPDAGSLETPAGAAASPGPAKPLDRFAPDAVFGWVRSASGAPVAGARLGLFERNRNAPFCTRRVAASTTDSAGRFRFEELRECHTFHLRIEAEHEVPVTHACYTGVAAHITLEPAKEVFGTILDAGTRRAIPGVVLKQSISYGNERILEQETVSDAEGRYRILSVQGPARGDNWIVVRPGFLPEFHDFGPAVSGEPHDLVLTRGKTLQGIVVEGESGQPLAGARVSAVGWGIELAQTDGSGAFRLLAPADMENDDAAIVQVEAEGYCTVHTAVPFVPDCDPAPLLPLLRGCTVSGIVADDHGVPLEDVHVTLVGDDDTTGKELPDPVHLVVDPPRNWRCVQRYLASPARTDAHGRFDLIALPPRKEPVGIGFDRPGYIPVLHPVTLDQTGRTVFLETTLAAVADAGEIRGSVTVNGAPRSAWVTCEAPLHEQHVRTSDAGTYSLRSVPPGEYRLRVEVRSWGRITHRDVPALQRQVKLEPCATLVEDFDVLCEQETVSGTVMRESGRPVADIAVHAWWEEQEYRDYSVSTATDEEGRFHLTLDRLPRSSQGILLTASEGSHSRDETRAVPGQEDVHLVLPDVGGVELRAVSEETGAAVTSVAVAWRASGSGGAYARWGSWQFLANEEGVVRLRVPAGTADLRIDGAASGYSVGFAESIPVRSDAASSVLVRLSRTTRLQLRQVPDPGTGTREFIFLLREDELDCVREGSREDHNLRLNGKEFLLDPDSPVAAHLPERLLSFGAGLQTIEHLLPGTYHFRCFTPGLRIEPATVAVDFDTPPVPLRVVKEE